MNEQRLQAYLNLIQTLLNCPSGEEPEILAANQELIDAGLVQTMEQVAAMMAEQGDENGADLLRDVAGQLAPLVEQALPPLPLEEEYLNFLSQVLQVTADSSSEPHVVYPLLQENLDKLDDTFAQLWRGWAAETLPDVEPEQAQSIAAVIDDFSTLISDFPLGSRASNLEIAITGYEIAATIFTRDAFPQEWARTQNNLGIAYSDRIRGEPADNLEVAIHCYTQALDVYTRDAFPQEWATMQNNLGLAYTNRIRGERADNLEVAIRCCTQALDVYTRDAFPQEWARTQNNLGIAYSDRIRGERADNLEVAIRCYTQALEVRTRDAFPQDWAATQHNLGAAYRARIRGEPADNLEVAIRCYTQALEVRTRDAFPQDWAMTQHNLGAAYTNRIRGERADNLEVAIRCYTQALDVYTRDAFPQNWATTQHNLGAAYMDRIRGEQAGNLEEAIRCYTQALEVHTRDAFPQNWAMTQHNLGLAYTYRIRGERADNLEVAIRCYTQALDVYTRDAFPQNWATTQHNLGLAYTYRIGGEPADNLEEAIRCYTQALEVHTRDAFPQDWAMTQNNLGLAHTYRIGGEPADNLEEAIRCYTQALEVNTRDAFPQNWAMTQNNLGIAYRNRIHGEPADNLEEAIRCYTQALEVHTRDAFPQNWAMTQNNLGIAYRNRIHGEPADNLEEAIRCYTQALEVRTRNTFPQAHAQTLFNLGVAYQNASQLQQAHDTFKDAIDTVELLRGEIFSGDEVKQKLAEEWNKLYQGMVEVCLELGYYDQAIEYVERSKARNLVELLATRDLYPKGEIPEAVRNELQRLRQEIDVENRRLAADPTPDYTLINQLRQRYNELYPFEPIQFDKIQNLLNDHTAIIQWYIFGDCFRAFIITRQQEQGSGRAGEQGRKQQPIVWRSSAEDLENLQNWGNEYLRAYYAPRQAETDAEQQELQQQWETGMASRLQQLAEILHINDLLDILSDIPATFDQLILVPHRYLHLFPLHALPVSPETRFLQKTQFLKLPTNPCLLDCFKSGVRYTPSCQLLERVQKYRRHKFQHLFGIQNPREDLVCADLEVETIRKNFSKRQVLDGPRAKKSALLIAAENTQEIKLWEELSLAHCVYFSCHGYFNPQSPLDSGLKLADGILSLADIFAHFNLSQCSIVTLSACETGMVDFSNISDEYIGLPSGFLVAGSPSVVSSLWSVNQFSTALLMIKFYEELVQPGNIAVALNEAQRWLRDATVLEFQDWVNQSQKLSLLWKIALRAELTEMEAQIGGSGKPFESHYHWAAFCAIGQGDR